MIKIIREGNKSRKFIIILFLFSFLIGTISVGTIDKVVSYPFRSQTTKENIPDEDLKIQILNNVGNRTFLSSITKLNGSNVIIAILDTGIDITHPDLDDLDDDNNTNDPKVIGGVSFAEGEPIYYGDPHGHGTYIAGIIAGTGNVSKENIGIAPQALLLNVKVLSTYTQNGTFYTKASWITSGIDWSINHGADIIVMAWAIPGLPTDDVNIAINKAVEKGIVVITAAGDDGPDFSTVGSPGMSAEGITVGNFDNSTNSVAENSSRGPTFDFRPGIDIVALGVNVTSTKSRNSTFGMEVDENYTRISSSASSTAFVAGISALYLQAFTYLNPWTLKLALMRTAIDLNLNPNIQGAGLLNETAAFFYLNQTLYNPLTMNRTYSPSLPYAGYIGTENKSLYFKDFSSNCSFGNYGEGIILTEYTNSTNFNASHILGGGYAVKYDDGNLTWFSDFEVLREIHYVSLGIYDRLVSILSDDRLMIIITIEAWEWANISRTSFPYWEFGNLTSYRIRFVFENIGSEPISNLNLFSWWKMDLFMNESDDFEDDDQGAYLSSENLFYASDTYDGTSNTSFIGFKSNTSAQMWYEVNSSENTYNFVQDDQIQNQSSSYGPGDVGFAMKWHLSNNIGINERTDFFGALAIGKSLDDLKNRTSWILTNVSEFNNITDICIARKNYTLTRMLSENETLESNIFVINVGTTAIDYGKVKFEANSTLEGITRIFNLSTNFEPYDIDSSISIILDPTYGGFYNLSWFAINATLSELEQIEKNMDYNDTNYDFQLTDNILRRNIVIMNSTFRNNFTPLLCTNFSLPYFPFMMNFSGDYAVFNLTILSSSVFSYISYNISGNVSDWINVEYEEESDYFGTNFIAIYLNTSFLTLPGSYIGNISILLDIVEFIIEVSFNIDFPKGRILFDLSHTSITSISDWPERKDSIHSGYFNFYKNVSSNGFKIDELLIDELTFDILEYYDCLIICDPEKNFTNSEIQDIQRYVENGGSLFLWVETPDECANTSINLLLNGSFDIEMRDTIYPNNSIICNHTVPDYNFAKNIFTIEMVSPVNISISDSSTIAHTLTDYVAYSELQNNGKVIVIGDSQIFDNEHIYDLNNSQFVINCLNWLINWTHDRVNITYFNITPVIKHLGDIICVTINLTAPNGTAIATNIAYAAFVLPNSSVLYMPMFHVRDGYHTTFYLSSFFNQTGNFTLYIYVDHVSGVLAYYNQTFNITDSIPGEPAPFLQYPIIQDQIFWITILWIILAGIIALWAISTIRLRRKIKNLKIIDEKKS
ncbi:MAG: S8 family serine peptidase [Candidatus Helarchaeota archaeon]